MALNCLWPNYFIFIGYFKVEGRKGGGVQANPMNPLWICHWKDPAMPRIAYTTNWEGPVQIPVWFHGIGRGDPNCFSDGDGEILPLLNLLLDISVLEMVKRAGVVATVGEYNNVYASVADHLRMPYFITSPVPVEQPFSPHHIRLVPDIRTYTLAIRDVFQHFSLKDVGVLYDTAYGKTLIPPPPRKKKNTKKK